MITMKIAENLANGSSFEVMAKSINYSPRQANTIVQTAYGRSYTQLIELWRLAAALDLIHNHQYSIISAVGKIYKSPCTKAFYNDLNEKAEIASTDIAGQKLFLDCMMLYKEIANAGKPIPLKDTSFAGRRALIWNLRHRYNVRVLSKPHCGYYVSADRTSARDCACWISNYRRSRCIVPYAFKV